MSKPCCLTFSIAPSIALAQLCHAFAVDCALDKFANRWHTNSLQQRKIRLGIGGEKQLDLFYRSGADHPLDPGIDCIVKIITRRSGHDRQETQVTRRGYLLAGLPVGKRPAGMLEYFERPNDPLAVGRVQSQRHFLIDRGKFAVKRARSVSFKPPVQPGANIGRNIWNLVKASHQRPQVQSGATDQDRQLSAGVTGSDYIERFLAPGSCRATFATTENTVEMMGNCRLVTGIWAGSHQFQIAVDLHRIRIDDLTVKRLSYLERQSGFAARRRPTDDNDRFPGQPFEILSATKRCTPPLSIRTRMVFSFALFACSIFF